MLKSLSNARTGTVAALDIGSSKVACLIASVTPGAPATNGAGPPADRGRVIGRGVSESHGIRRGAIVDINLAERCVRRAITVAEAMADEQIQRVMVSLTGGSPQSSSRDVDYALNGQEVSESDLQRALDAGAGPSREPGRSLIHAFPVGFRLDGSDGVRDPRGLWGQRLSTRFHLVSAEDGAVHNLRNLVGRCDLKTDALVSAPLASALACLGPDAVELGATLIDMGGGTTTIAVTLEGRIVHIDSVPVGGAHVTSDIARGLGTTLDGAERLKTLHGSCLPSSLDERETIEIPIPGEDRPGRTMPEARSILVGIVRPRIEETLELVSDRLDAVGITRSASRQVVLTGGASQLTGIRDLAQLVLGGKVQLGRPTCLDSPAAEGIGPELSACAGMIAYAIDPGLDAVRFGSTQRSGRSGAFSRFGSWLRENF